MTFKIYPLFQLRSSNVADNLTNYLWVQFDLSGLGWIFFNLTMVGRIEKNLLTQSSTPLTSVIAPHPQELVIVEWPLCQRCVVVNFFPKSFHLSLTPLWYKSQKHILFPFFSPLQTIQRKEKNIIFLSFLLVSLFSKIFSFLFLYHFLPLIYYGFG